jgi:hypothetical protein
MMRGYERHVAHRLADAERGREHQPTDAGAVHGVDDVGRRRGDEPVGLEGLADAEHADDGVLVSHGTRDRFGIRARRHRVT